MNEAPTPEGPLHILVIDDDPAMCELITQILLPDKHQLIVANSAEEGLEQLPWFTFQVAFLDHNLPGMEGLVLGEYLRQNNPHMQIALVTGAVDDRVIRQGKALSIMVIAKPFQIEEILDVVSTWREAETNRQEARRDAALEGYTPDFSGVWRELPGLLGAPAAPKRLEEHLAHRLKTLLNNLSHRGRFNEEERLAALAGLLTAQCLGLSLPKTSSGETFFEAYDALMREHGRRVEFKPG